MTLPLGLDSYLQINQFTGSIPSNIGNATSLQMMYVPSNQWQIKQCACGNAYYAINSSLMHCACVCGVPIECRSLNNNQLSGTIPSSISNLNKLKYLYGLHDAHC
jgi:hypothetical protein